MSITLGNARRNASSTVRPLMPRLYTCGSNRSSSRRRGILSQSCLMLFLVSVMHPLYLTETSETRTNYLESQHLSTLRPAASACQHGAFGAFSARFGSYGPSLSAFQPLLPRSAAHEELLPSAVAFYARGEA